MDWLFGKPETLESLITKVNADPVGFGHIRVNDWIVFLKFLTKGAIRESIEGAIRPDILSTYTPEKIRSELAFLVEQEKRFVLLDSAIRSYLTPANTAIADKIRAAVKALFATATERLRAASRVRPAPPVQTYGQKIAESFEARRAGKRKTKKRKRSTRKRRSSKK